MISPVTLTRRHLLKLGAAAGAALVVPGGWKSRRAFAAIPGGSLDPTRIAKYVMPLVIPPAMPPTGDARRRTDYYEIAVRQFVQQILPAGTPTTTVWSYGSASHPGTFNYPAFTIEARFARPVRVKWINDLKDGDGRYLPHLLPIDPTLHWANPPGGLDGRDMRPTFTATPGRYTGPVPIVTHLHGGHSAQESDGYPEAWFLPAATDLPAGFAADGSSYEAFKMEFAEKFGVAWEPGTATLQYENDQRAATLWYHDHTLGMTRANVYAGPAGFYLLRRGPGDLPAGVLPGPAPGVGADPFGRFYEIPIAIQDRSFNADGSLFYPDSREFFDGFGGPYIPGSDVPPIWNPEFFGNTIVVNGRTWPYLEVEPRRYRFRFLNGCNARFLALKIVPDPLAPRPVSVAIPVWQIGADGGFLRAPVMLDQLLLAPAERADVIVDFTGLAAGTELYLVNEGPDEPFGGGVANTDFPASDPLTTGQVMKFAIVPLASRDASVPPEQLALPAPGALPAASHTRQLSLNEEVSTRFDGPIAAKLGTLDAGGNPVALRWEDPITENPGLGATEIWEIHNFTEDAHPIHVHQVQFQVVDREPMDGAARPPESWETGRKDTVIAYPSEITRVKARFDLPGLYVWHCHILEHEDNEMMRPYVVGPDRRRGREPAR
ncbi:MAG: multicopper oxidase domain-containing protein [Candidatus Rokubacteria bacterium]|nr:multicopper oxidase domain-containing protein [Candidatus Rokubacteria bacterium]